LAIATVFITGCKKEEVITSSKDLISTQLSVTSKNGVLIFKDKEALNSTLEKLIKMDASQISAWEKSYNFISQESIYKQINEAEIALEEVIFEGIDEDISIAELTSLGLLNRHTLLYNDYIQNGLITELTEADGSQSFELSLLNKGLASILNEKGIVIVGNKMYHYSACCVKVMNSTDLSKSMDLINSTQSDATKNIEVFNELNNVSRSVRTNWSKQTVNPRNPTDPTDPWIYDGNKKRFNFEIVGNSGISGSGNLLHSTFYIEARGQNRRLWRWKYRGSYQPIAEVRGSWDYYYEVLHSEGYRPERRNDLPDLDDVHSNVYFRPAEPTNRYKQSLAPNGLWSISQPWIFYYPVDVFTYDFRVDFYGGPSGFQIHWRK